jgi:beta-alanine--pyruvate transaminase
MHEISWLFSRFRWVKPIAQTASSDNVPRKIISIRREILTMSNVTPLKIERNDLESSWMPYTANRAFKAAPRLFVGAKDMHYTTHDGRQVLDGMAGLWCTNAGHCRDRIVEAIQAQAAEMDYAPAFQVAHPKNFELASRLAMLLPGDIDHVFYTNSGSEAVDTALKIALAYHRSRGEAHRQRLIGRVRGYHGVGFGGTSVGGMVANRKHWGTLLPGVDHLPHTYNRDKMAFSRGQPEWGAHLADALEDLVNLHDASTIAAVIVEPVACSTGVLVPPVGYLERLREICDAHGILLIFDEVITGFGRLGAPFAAEYFKTLPDLITSAKGLTSGTVPMGAVCARRHVYDAIVDSAPEGAIELFHGYTYSGHPLACAAALATLDLYEEEGLFTRAGEMAGYWADKLHGLKGKPYVVDLRNIGLIAAVELEPVPGKPTARAQDVFARAFEKGLLVRSTGDTVALSPPLIISKAQIDEIFEILAAVLDEMA